MCIFINNIILYFLNLTEQKIYSSNYTDCTICMDNDKNTIFYPCRHFYCCNNCSRSLKLCPICRTDIRMKIRLHIV